ncbi:TPA: hypothetical protein ACXNW8_001340 [Clostridium botulinum]|uniref:hypothetical protein n=1 Tax=Clostridium botulinum TaxID=1491 RepID=UPI001C9B6CB9|nr:hypothetical protein [Clostridium botulinum]MBY6909542.1 hypothetical protein [Clostridium botulinum]
MHTIEYIKNIRCPICDGKIHIPKEDTFEKFRSSYVIPSVSIPYCKKCGKKWEFMTIQDGELSVVFREYRY